MHLILLLIIFLSIQTQAQEERIILKGTKIKPVFVPNVGIGEPLKKKILCLVTTTMAFL